MKEGIVGRLRTPEVLKVVVIVGSFDPLSSKFSGPFKPIRFWWEKEVGHPEGRETLKIRERTTRWNIIPDDHGEGPEERDGRKRPSWTFDTPTGRLSSVGRGGGLSTSKWTLRYG